MRLFVHNSLSSKALLFSPAAILCGLTLLWVENAYARTVVRAEDSPDQGVEAVVYVLYSPFYPLIGEVRAFVDLRKLPGHEPILTHDLGTHRWFSEASEAYQAIEWTAPGRLTIRSADGKRSHLVLSRPPPVPEDGAEGRRG